MSCVLFDKSNLPFLYLSKMWDLFITAPTAQYSNNQKGAGFIWVFKALGIHNFKLSYYCTVSSRGPYDDYYEKLQVKSNTIVQHSMALLYAFICQVIAPTTQLA